MTYGPVIFRSFGTGLLNAHLTEFSEWLNRTVSRKRRLTNVGMVITTWPRSARSYDAQRGRLRRRRGTRSNDGCNTGGSRAAKCIVPHK